MRVKTSELKENISIRIFADLTGWNSTEGLIREEILRTPFKLWKLDEFNVIDLGNDEVADIFVYESPTNKLIFNVNEIF